MPVRLKDIARDLGVSVVTVSKVLRNHADIGDETRDRVRKRMRELNYQPNLAARTLVTGRTFSMGLVVPDLVHPFFAVVATGISRVLRGRGYGLVISCSEEDSELEQQEIEQLLARRVDALLIASAQLTLESFRRIEEHKTRYVLLDRQFAGLPANFVGVDDVAVGSMATGHLVDIGCRALAHIGGAGVSTSIGRREGFRRTLAARGLPLLDSYIVARALGDNAGDLSGYAAMKKLLRLDPRPDGVFCHNDPTAMGAMNAILDAGLRIPEDIAVVGCGNVRYADSLRVPLSSVDQDSETIGERAANLALGLLESKLPARPQTILVEPKLVIRASTARRLESPSTSSEAALREPAADPEEGWSLPESLPR
jgi:LacI family transcriptional regulator